MKRCIWLLALGLFLSVSAVQAGRGEMFFTGKDFAGWEGLTGSEGYWSVKDKAIVGVDPQRPQVQHLPVQQEKIQGLRAEISGQAQQGAGNSGVQIRSQIHDQKTFAVTGPQCDMGRQYWGSLYGENFGGMMKAADAKLVKKVLKEDDFNDYYIKCVGKHVTIKLNGETTVDDDFPKMPDDGIIAWQLHAGGPMIVMFRRIEFKEISEKK